MGRKVFDKTEAERVERVRCGPVEVSRLALGASPLGNLFRPVSDRDARAVVEAAHRAGIRYVDTAPHYGLGLSEQRLGLALARWPRRSWTVSSKVGRRLVPLTTAEGDDLAEGFAVPATHRRVWDFSADGVRRSVEESLERLGLAYLHDPGRHLPQACAEALPELARLRAEGLVGAVGARANDSGTLCALLRTTDLDAVLLAGRYSLLDQSGLADLLPLASARGNGVVIGGVFNSGLLADPRAGSPYDYTVAPPRLLARAQALRRVCADHGVPLRAAALRFPAGHPAVVSVLVGARTAAEVEDAVAMFALPVPAALWAELRRTGLLAAQVPVPADESG